MNLSHIVTLFNFLGLVFVGLRYNGDDRLYEENKRCYQDHEKSITNMKMKLSKIDADLSSIDFELESLKHNIVDNDSKVRVKKEEDRVSSSFTRSPNNQLSKIPREKSDRDSIMSDRTEKKNGVFHSKKKSVHATRRKATQVQALEEPETKCLLMSFDNSTFVQTFNHSNIPEFSKSFDLSLKVKTDKYPEETHWTLSPLNNQEHKLIDFLGDDESKIALAMNTMHIFKYSCFVSSSEEGVDNACFDFSIFDSYEDGMCCWAGVGYYSLNLEKKELISERLYAYDRKTSFCLADSDITDDEEDDPSNITLYPSRECLNENCICDSSPELLSNYNDIESKYPGLHELKSRTMMNILILSGTENLPDVTSPQYMAACWVLNDDPYLAQYSNATAIKASDAEKRMMQRYILAVHYFATKPENWNQDFSFLSHKSECDWNFQYPDRVRGIHCDENNNVISFHFEKQNLEGTIIQEISGLKLLEFLIYEHDEKLVGKIPSSISRLPQLQYLILSDISLTGTIPQELFRATKMKALYLRKTMITGTIPLLVGNLQALQILDLRENNLSGSIPNTIYSLTDLRRLILNGNMLSSTISPSVGNLDKLRRIILFDNNLSGSLPSNLGKLKMLFQLNLSKNKFSGAVPSTLKSLTSLENLNLFENDLSGEMPSELCEVESLTRMTADCRNDVFLPALSCSCCSYCSDKSPVWNGVCPDSKLKFVIDHVVDGTHFNSELLKWDVTDIVTGKEVMGDGPYFSGLSRKSHYETCVALSDCFSFNLGMSKALVDERPHVIWHPNFDFHTNYSIYWNEKLVLEDTFKMDIYNATSQPEITFHYDPLTDEVFVGSSCSTKEIICGDKSLPLNSEQRVMYNAAVRVSGTTAFDDIYSPHSRALCWIVENDSWLKDTDISELEALFIQRYVVTLLHLISVAGLFGDDEYPPPSHECSWEGITCIDDEKKKMVSLSLSSAANQIIEGTLIEEIGSLAFLEILHLDQTGLKGTIPSVFSNLYSLRELDLSDNALTGTIPDNFFNQLERLELFDLSDNDMTGVIPVSIGSYSNVEVIRLNNNNFTGELPLDGFTKFNLKHLDLSENKLSSSISPSLLKHRSLEHLGLGSNFFVGSLEESIFNDLTKLKYINVSKNELTGIIPTFHHNMSDMTHFDMHANKFTGTLPISLTRVASLEYLNLQGNKITGSIPFELNNLKELHTLVLSHNELKGAIPLTFEELQNLNSLHLQANQLSGEAPIVRKKMKGYITDCGYPSVLLNPIDCPSCSICCNSENLCSGQSKSALRPAIITVIFLLILTVVIAFIYSFRARIISGRSMSERFETVGLWKASEMIGDKSVYHFFLTPSTQGWYVGLFCAIAQLLTLFLFINAADIASEGSDLEYTMTCSKNSLECENEASRTPLGYLVFTLILGCWLLRDIIGSVKLFMIAMLKKNIDFMFASMILFMVTTLSAWTSVYYNLAIATKDTDLIVNAVILLFVNELDERVFQLVEAFHLEWASEVDESIQRNSYHEGDQKLNVSRAVNKVTKRLTEMSSSVRRKSNLMNDRDRDRYDDIKNSNSDMNNPVSEHSIDLENDI